MLLWTITSVTRYGCLNYQTFFLKSATQELIEVLPDPKEKTLLAQAVKQVFKLRQIWADFLRMA